VNEISRDKKHQVGVLLIGFNRPKDLSENLYMVLDSRLAYDEVYVSIDGPRLENELDAEASTSIRSLLKEVEESNQIQVRINRENLGCDVHIPQAIEYVLKECDAVIVLEDDVRISKGALEEFIALTRLQLLRGLPTPIVSMSGLTFWLRKPTPIIWRQSKYFSPWGFSVNKHFWNIHRVSVQKRQSLSKSTDLYSLSWNRWGQRKKNIWHERFCRGNYDYAIQRSLIEADIKTIAPVFRLADNVGHGREDAAHTKFRRPRYLSRRVSSKPTKGISIEILKHGPLIKIFNFIDSNTWAGDGFLSKRGRTVGFRSLLRSLQLRRKVKNS
jgi:hypothetical protein